MIGYDSILATLSQAIYLTLCKNQEKKINEIHWDDHFPVTGLPFIARVSAVNTFLDGEKILKGQTIRLYLESAGFNHSADPTYSELFFGYGIHKCAGTHVSKKIWDVFTKKIAVIDKKFIIQPVSYRDNDYLFLKYQNIALEIYE